MLCIKICFFEAGAGRSRDFMGGAKNVHQESKKKLSRKDGWAPQHCFIDFITERNTYLHFLLYISRMYCVFYDIFPST